MTDKENRRPRVEGRGAAVKTRREGYPREFIAPSTGNPFRFPYKDRANFAGTEYRRFSCNLAGARSPGKPDLKIHVTGLLFPNR
jgi:hypothetical protein